MLFLCIISYSKKQSNGFQFIYDNSGVAGFTYNSATYLYQKDVLGNICKIIDSVGNVVVQYKYDAWGNHVVLDENGAEIVALNHIGHINPYRYRSYYFDNETNLYYLKSRYYDPETGRFTTIDDTSYLDPDTINGLNLYAYCGNNPVMRIDPNGNFWLIFLIIAAAVVGISGVMGGVSAAMSGGSKRDIFVGIGKGLLSGLAFMGSVAMVAGGVMIGMYNILGSTMVNYGLSVGANMLEVFITQFQKSYSEGDNFWGAINDTTLASFANLGRIVTGRVMFADMEIIGTRLITKLGTLFKYFGAVVKEAQLWKFSVALKNVSKSFWLGVDVYSTILGYAFSIKQILTLFESMVYPNFKNGKWILF